MARHIRQKWPKSKIIGCSISRDAKTKDWFINNCDGYLDKAEIKPNDNLIRKIKNVIEGKKDYQSFIVHGHDNDLLNELKDYITRVLKLPTPIILREQPSLGRTIIEKFEDYSDQIDFVFVLLTPDDKVLTSEIEVRRARQNVIFELGYFYSKLRRGSGKVILIYKGKLDLPSDISGIIYLQVDKNIKSISDDIRNELDGILPRI